MKTFKHYLSLMLMLLVVLPMSASSSSEGEEANTFLCSEISPAAGEVKSLKEFILTFADANNPFAQVGGIKPNAKVNLYDDADMLVAKGTLETVSGIKNKSKVKVVLDQEVSTSGSYYLLLPKGVVYDAHFDETEPDYGVSLGAVYNPMLRFDYVIKGETSYTFDPDPSVELQSVPSLITMTVSKEIGYIEMAYISLGGSGQLPVEYDINGNVATFSLPVESLQGQAGFALMAYAYDLEGNPLCYNDPDMIFVEYNVALPANSFVCESITPAEGKVDSLKNFNLTFKNYASPWGDNIGGVDTSKVVVLYDVYETPVATGTINVDVDKMVSVADVSLDQVVTAPGTYMLVVEEGTFYNKDFDEAEADFGVEKFKAIYNPQLIYYYTIEDKSVTFDPSPVDTVFKNVPDSISMTFEKNVAKVEDVVVMIDWANQITLDSTSFVIKDNVVTLTLPVEQMQGITSFGLGLSVTDVDGNLVTFGNFGDGYVYVEYQIEAPANSFTCVNIDPAEGDVLSLKEFNLYFMNPSSMDDLIGGIDSTKQVVLMDEYYTNVAYGKVVVDMNSWEPVVKVVLDREIVGEGTYTLNVPEGTIYNSKFNPNEEDFGVSSMGAIYNPELNFTYNVLPLPSLVADPDPALGLKEIPNEITFTFLKDIKSVKDVAFNMGSGYSIPVDSSKVVVDSNKVVVPVPVDLVEGFPGFVVVFYAEDVDGNMITYGDVKDLVQVSYDILSPANILSYYEVTPAEGEVESLEQFKLLFSADMVGGFDETKVITLTDANGAVVATAYPSFDFDVMNMAIVTLDSKITAPGTYTLTIPEGTIYDGMYNGGEKDLGVARYGATYNPEIVLSYTIGTATGVEGVQVENAAVNVYNLNGVLVGHSLKNLPKGIYIVNGKKVVVK